MQTMNDKPKQSEEAMIKNIAQSTDSALQALQFFHQSLVSAKLPQSINSYRVMCDTLVGQRIWMLDKNEPEIFKKFEELSHIAQSINDILGPYVKHLDKLSGVGETNENTEVEWIEDESNSTQKTSMLNSESQVNERLSTSTAEQNNTVSNDNSKPSQYSDQDKVLAVLRKNKKRTSFTKIRSESGLKRATLQELLAKLTSQGLIVGKNVGGREMYEINA